MITYVQQSARCQGVNSRFLYCHAVTCVTICKKIYGKAKLFATTVIFIYKIKI